MNPETKKVISQHPEGTSPSSWAEQSSPPMKPIRITGVASIVFGAIFLFLSVPSILIGVIYMAPLLFIGLKLQRAQPAEFSRARKWLRALIFTSGIMWIGAVFNVFDTYLLLAAILELIALYALIITNVAHENRKHRSLFGAPSIFTPARPADTATLSLSTPKEIKGLNFGAFIWTWIWGIGNRVWISLLMFVPFVSMVVPFVLLFKGNEWAWRSRHWQSVEEFQEEQRLWRNTGIIICIISFVLLIAALYYVGSHAK